MHQFIKSILRCLRRLRRSSAKTACQQVPWELLPFSFEVDWCMETPKGVDESTCFHVGGCLRATASARTSSAKDSTRVSELPPLPPRRT